MAYGKNQFVWLVAALAAFAGQIVPQAWCRACDRPCCTSEAGHETAYDHGSRPADAGSTAACPLCTASAACPSPSETTEPPCHCQLDARQSVPLVASRAAGSASDVAAWPGGVAVPSVPPRSSGVSADYLSASLAVPIRPPRILFGVWRN